MKEIIVVPMLSILSLVTHGQSNIQITSTDVLELNTIDYCQWKNPKGDKNLMGFIAAKASKYDRFREYLTFEINQPLKEGKEYKIEITFTNGSLKVLSKECQCKLGKWGVEGLGVNFHTKQYLPNQTLPILESIEDPVEIKFPYLFNEDLITISANFFATEPFTYFTIGFFEEFGGLRLPEFVKTSFINAEDLARYFVSNVKISESNQLLDYSLSPNVSLKNETLITNNSTYAHSYSLHNLENSSLLNPNQTFKESAILNDSSGAEFPYSVGQNNMYSNQYSLSENKIESSETTINKSIRPKRLKAVMKDELEKGPPTKSKTVNEISSIASATFLVDVTGSMNDGEEEILKEVFTNQIELVSNTYVNYNIWVFSDQVREIVRDAKNIDGDIVNEVIGSIKQNPPNKFKEALDKAVNSARERFDADQSNLVVICSDFNLDLDILNFNDDYHNMEYFQKKIKDNEDLTFIAFHYNTPGSNRNENLTNLDDQGLLRYYYVPVTDVQSAMKEIFSHHFINIREISFDNNSVILKTTGLGRDPKSQARNLPEKGKVTFEISNWTIDKSLLTRLELSGFNNSYTINQSKESLKIKKNSGFLKKKKLPKVSFENNDIVVEFN